MLSKPVGLKHFIKMSVKQRFSLVERIYKAFGHKPEIIAVLSSKYYAPYLLLVLTERNIFMRISDFSVYQTAIENTTAFELEQISKISEDFKDRFIAFLRFINILS